MKTALITGITGQDGSYLAELLLKKGYKVHGLVQRHSNYQMPNIDGIKNKLNLHYGDINSEHHICSIVNEVKPDEIYNLAAQSDVGISFEIPEETGLVTGIGVLKLLEAIRKFSPHSKFYQASTSELFGNTPAPQNEDSCMTPTSPYAVAKLYAHHMTRVYRESYGIFGCCGILFNHESPRRGLNFVTRKITNAVAEIVEGKREDIAFGNIDSKRDWGYAPDYVEAMWMMLQRDKAEDFVIGTGETHTVAEFIEYAFEVAGLDWTKHIVIDKKLFRPSETRLLCANCNKAKKELGWSPKVNFRGLVNIMVDADLKLVKV